AILRTPTLRNHDGTPSLPPPSSMRSPGSSLSALLDHLDDASRTAQALSSALDARAEAAAPVVRTTASEHPGQRRSEPSARVSRGRHLLLVWRGDWLVLRDACSPRSTFFQHGARVAVTIGFTAVVARYVTTYPHWVTVTTLAVLQPYSGATASRVVQRVVGTVLGSVAAVVIDVTLRSPVLLGVAMFPLSVAAVMTQRRNYRLFTFFLTPVFVLHAERFSGDWWTAVVRAADAGVGGAVALFAALVVFPSRERKHLPELLARMLGAVADYAQAVLEGLPQRSIEAVEAGIAATRRDAGLALGEAESALERLLSEPGHGLEDEELSLQLITYSRRAAGALTMLDTYAARGLGISFELAPELTRAITQHVVGTLRGAAEAAHGRKPAALAPAVPELPEQLDPRARAPLSRLLRGAGLIEEVASRARFAEPPRAAPPRPFYPG
ncbi:MAG TPA: FUSC family protein, partial [Polyangiaceae bacterium]